LFLNIASPSINAYAKYWHCLKINQKIKTYDNLSGIENTLKITWKIAIFLEICVTNKKI